MSGDPTPVRIACRRRPDLDALARSGLIGAQQSGFREVLGHAHPADFDALRTLACVRTVEDLSHTQVVQKPRDATLRKTNVRASAKSKVGVSGTDDGVWFRKDGASKFEAPGGATGKGVVIAIHDSGIDWYSPMFTHEDSAGKLTTRILGICDETRNTGNKPPGYFGRASWFPKSEIEKAINKMKAAGPGKASTATAADISGDEGGHGTQCAMIAAGHYGGVMGSDLCGVAPEAELLIIKRIDGASFSGPASIKWLFDYAASDEMKNKRMVISLSLGDVHGLHDGLGKAAEQLNKIIKTGAGQPIVCVAAGNEGHKGGAIKFKIPRAGHVSFELYFSDGYVGKEDFNTRFQIAIPHRTEFLKPDGTLDISKVIMEISRVKSATSGSGTSGPTTETKKYSLLGAHGLLGETTGKIGARSEFKYVKEMKTRTKTDGTKVTIHSSKGTISAPPYAKKSANSGGWETQTVKITGPRNTEGYIWFDENAGPIKATPGITIEGISSIAGWATAKNAITVAEYRAASAKPDKSAGEKHRARAHSSGVGPLLDFAKTGTAPDKPNIAGPGGMVVPTTSQTEAELGDVSTYISDAVFTQETRMTPKQLAESQKASNALKDPNALQKVLASVVPKVAKRHAELRKTAFPFEDHFFNPDEAFPGTSAATPFVAGAVACMLEINPNLTVKDIQDIFADPKNCDKPADGARGAKRKNFYGGGLINVRKACAAAKKLMTP